MMCGSPALKNTIIGNTDGEANSYNLIIIHCPVSLISAQCLFAKESKQDHCRVDST